MARPARVKTKPSYSVTSMKLDVRSHARDKDVVLASDMEDPVDELKDFMVGHTPNAVHQNRQISHQSKKGRLRSDSVFSDSQR